MKFLRIFSKENHFNYLNHKILYEIKKPTSIDSTYKIRRKKKTLVFLNSNTDTVLHSRAIGRNRGMNTDLKYYNSWARASWGSNIHTARI